VPCLEKNKKKIKKKDFIFNNYKAILNFYEKKKCSYKSLKKYYKKFINQIQSIELLQIFNKKNKSNAIIEINPGAGGIESQDWAKILMRMYIMWAKKKKKKTKKKKLKKIKRKKKKQTRGWKD